MSSVLIHPFLPQSLDTRSPTKAGERQSVSKFSQSSHLYPSLVLGFQEHVDTQSLLWVLRFQTQILMLA